MRTLLNRFAKATAILLGLVLPSIAAPTSPPAGNYIINISTKNSTQVFKVSSGTVNNQFSLTYISTGSVLAVNSQGVVVSTTLPTSSSGGGGSGGNLTNLAGQFAAPYYSNPTSSNTISGSTGVLIYPSSMTINGAKPILSTGTLQSGATVYVSSANVTGNFTTTGGAVKLGGTTVNLGDSASQIFFPGLGNGQGTINGLQQRFIVISTVIAGNPTVSGTISPSDIPPGVTTYAQINPSAQQSGTVSVSTVVASSVTIANHLNVTSGITEYSPLIIDTPGFGAVSGNINFTQTGSITGGIIHSLWFGGTGFNSPLLLGNTKFSDSSYFTNLYVDPTYGVTVLGSTNNVRAFSVGQTMGSNYDFFVTTGGVVNIRRLTNTVLATDASGNVISTTVAGGGGGSGTFTGLNSSGNPNLASSATFVAGSGVTLSQSGSSITITATAGSGSTGGSIIASTQGNVSYYSAIGTNTLNGLIAGTSGQVLMQGASLPFWGTSMSSRLGDFLATNTSSAVQTIGANCSSTTPCLARIGSVLFTDTAPVTLTISGTTSTGIVFWYLSSSLVLTAGYTTAATMTCSAGCSTASGIVAFPPDSIPLWETSFTNNVWDSVSETMDFRSSYSRSLITIGSGITSVYNTILGNQTLSTDPTIVPRYFVGTGSPTITCTQGRDIYTDTTSVNTPQYYCSNTNTWAESASTSTAGGGGGSGAYPGGSASQIQYQVNGTTFGGIPGSSVGTSSITIGPVSISTSSTISINPGDHLLNISSSPLVGSATDFFLDTYGNEVILGSMTAGTYFGGSLSTCGDSSHALAWSGGSFSCQSIAGGSGGSSALQVTSNGVQITSPTASMNFGTQFTLAAVGSTSTIAMNNNLVISTITASSATVTTQLNLAYLPDTEIPFSNVGGLVGTTDLELSASHTLSVGPSIGRTGPAMTIDGNGNSTMLYLNGSSGQTQELMNFRTANLSDGFFGMEGSSDHFVWKNSGTSEVGRLDSSGDFTIPGWQIVGGSESVKGAGGLGVSYNINVGSMTGAGLTSCSGGSNAVTWNSTTNQFGCNTISGGGSGVSVYPATATASFPFGLSASTGVYTSTVTALAFAANGTGNLSVTENGLTGQLLIGTGTVTQGHYAVWGDSKSLVDGGTGTGGGGGTWGSITGTLSSQTDLQSALTSIGVSTAAIAVDTGTTFARIVSVGVSTAAIQVSLNSVATSTAAIGVSTASLQTQITSVANSTYTLAQATGTLYTLVNTKLSLSSITATSPIVYNNTSGAFTFAPLALSTASFIGTLPIANLVSTVAFTNSSQTFTALQTFTSTVAIVSTLGPNLFSASTATTGVPFIAVSSIPASAAVDFLLNVSSAGGTTVLGIQNNGHIISSGTTPSVGTCGTTPAIRNNSTDMGGAISWSGTTATCAVNFGSAYTSAPFCVTNSTTAPTMTTTGFTVTSPSVTASTITWNCWGGKGG